MSRTYKEKSYADDHASDVVLPRKGDQIAILSVADKIPDVCESSQQISNNGMVIRLAVVGREPSTGA